MTVDNYDEQFLPTFYLCVQYVPAGSLSYDTDFELPFDSRAFTNYNAKRLTILEVLEAGYGLPSNNTFNLQSIYQTGASQSILLIIERPAQPTVPQQLIIDKISNLNYQTITQEQFYHYRDDIIRTMPFLYLAFQLRVQQLIDLVKPLANGRFKTLVQTFNNNNRVGINGTPSQEINLQWATYFINQSLLSNYWSSFLFNAGELPNPPTRPTVAGDLVKPVITNIINLPTSQTWEIKFGDDTYYQSYIDGFLALRATNAPVATFTSTKIVHNVWTITGTGMTPSTEYIMRARTELQNPVLIGDYAFSILATPAAPPV
jgi:hypothetical protein